MENSKFYLITANDNQIIVKVYDDSLAYNIYDCIKARGTTHYKDIELIECNKEI